MRANTPADFWAKVTQPGPDECWLWTGSVGANGYGQVSIAMRRVMPHRYAYELTNGPIPDGLFICHHCDVPLCCNPAHLYAGTAADNNRDRDRRGRGKAALHPAKHGTHSGYLRHLRQRDGDWAMPACEPCKSAANAAQRAFQARRKSGGGGHSNPSLEHCTPATPTDTVDATETALSDGTQR